MANDESMATLVEDWIVVQLQALNDYRVEPWEGSLAQSGQKLVEELVGKATDTTPYATVMFERDRAAPLEEGEQAYEPVYAIYLVAKNGRPGAARRGDGTTIGTNGLRDWLRNALHDKSPNVGKMGYFTDQSQFNGVDVVFQRADAFIMRAEIVVRESPTG